jgi:hypothetical protein
VPAENKEAPSKTNQGLTIPLAPHRPDSLGMAHHSSAD